MTKKKSVTGTTYTVVVYDSDNNEMDVPDLATLFSYVAEKMSLQDVADRTGYTREYVRQLAVKGEIPHEKFENTYIFYYADVEAFATSRGR